MEWSSTMYIDVAGRLGNKPQYYWLEHFWLTHLTVRVVTKCLVSLIKHYTAHSSGWAGTTSEIVLHHLRRQEEHVFVDPALLSLFRSHACQSSQPCGTVIFPSHRNKPQFAELLVVLWVPGRPLSPAGTSDRSYTWPQQLWTSCPVQLEDTLKCSWTDISWQCCTDSHAKDSWWDKRTSPQTRYQTQGCPHIGWSYERLWAQHSRRCESHPTGHHPRKTPPGQVFLWEFNNLVCFFEGSFLTLFCNLCGLLWASRAPGSKQRRLLGHLPSSSRHELGVK